MSKGLNPQDVANALTNGTQLRKDFNGWVIPVPETVDIYKGVVICRTVNNILLPLNINCDEVPEGTVFEKQEEFEDGELVLAVILGIYTPQRYYDKGKVYYENCKTGGRSAGGAAIVDKIIKYKGNESLLGTEVK